MPSEVIKKEEAVEKAQSADIFVADEKEEAAMEFFQDRRGQLFRARQNVLNRNIEDIWRAADRAYQPHSTETSSKKRILASDDEIGWRSRPVVQIGADDWQEDSVPVNAYIKIQTALGILIDRNPEGVFNPSAPQFEANTLLMEQLYKRSWDIARSKEQLKLFIFNLAKYGWAAGRTYPLVIKRDVRDIKKFVPSNPNQNQYEDATVTVFDDIFREAMSPWQVWIDDMARPDNMRSVNDWLYYKDFTFENFMGQFGHLRNAKFVKPSRIGEISEDNLRTSSLNKVEIQNDRIVRVWFYENLERDMFYIQTDPVNQKVVLVNEPLPFSPKNKRLSRWQGYWTLRDDRTVYGIGVYEAMRNSAKIHTKVRNMTIDQVVLSIYKPGFHQNANQLEGDGTIQIKPGVSTQVLNPREMTWMDIPGPGRDAKEMIEFTSKEMDDATGITPTIEGAVTGKTAFEVAQSREFSLKRLRIPLQSIATALETEAYITIGLIQETYSVPKVNKIGGRNLISQYREEILQNPDIFFVKNGQLFMNEFRTVLLNIEENEDGEMEASESSKFFTVTPDKLKWEGVINVNPQSVLFESEILRKQQTQEMVNTLVPMFVGDPRLLFKPAKQILKANKQDPKDWLPDSWLQFEQTGELTPELTPGVQGQPEAQPGAVEGAQAVPEEVEQLFIDQPQL